MSFYDPARIYRDQLELPPLHADTPWLRFVHVRADGTEENFATRPANVPVIEVQILKTRKGDNTFLEQTITAGSYPPPGKGWEEVGSVKHGDDRWRWQRRRKRVWVTNKEGA
jgi:hypothetical protein